MNQLKGKLYKTSKNYYSYEVYDADTSFIFKLAAVVIQMFQFTPTNRNVGLEQVFMDFVKDGVKITIGWDIWSGCFIMAHDNAGDACVDEIGKYLEVRLNML